MTKVTMVNPNLPGREIRVPQRVVVGHQRAGWVVKDDQASPLPPEAPNPEPPTASVPKAIPDARSAGAKTGKE